MRQVSFLGRRQQVLQIVKIKDGLLIVFPMIKWVIEVLVSVIGPLVEAAIVGCYIVNTLSYFNVLIMLPKGVGALLLSLNGVARPMILEFSLVLAAICMIVTHGWFRRHTCSVPIFSLATLAVLCGGIAIYVAFADLGLASITAQWGIVVWFSVLYLISKRKPSKPAIGTLQIASPKSYTCALCQKKSTSDPCRSCSRRELQRVHAQNLRAKKAGLPGTLTLPDWLATLKSFDYKCAYCQTANFTLLEHYIPIPYEGTTVENCVPGCRSCNAKKSNEHPDMIGK